MNSVKSSLKISIEPIPALKDNYIWAIINPDTSSTLIVDPGEALPVLTYLQQHALTLTGILVTHHHWDHRNGVAALVNAYPVNVFSRTLLIDSESTKNIQIADGDIVSTDPHLPQYQVISIPGHTLDHVAYYAEDALFCGDTLFAGGCGRLFEGTAEQLYNSLKKIAALPPQTKIYCGHEYTLNNLNFAEKVEPQNALIKQRIEKVKDCRGRHLPSLPSLLSEEQQTNPFLRCHIPEVIRQVESYAKKTLSDPVAVFAALRKWKDQF